MSYNVIVSVSPIMRDSLNLITSTKLQKTISIGGIATFLSSSFNFGKNLAGAAPDYNYVSMKLRVKFTSNCLSFTFIITSLGTSGNVKWWIVDKSIFERKNGFRFRLYARDM